MKKNIEIPAMGESISEGVIGTFLKEEGVYVSENEEIIEIETEKVNQPLYAPASGTVHWSVKEGDALPIGAVIGHIDTDAKAPVEETKPVEVETPKEAKPIETVLPKASKEGIRQFSQDEKVPVKEKTVPSKSEKREPMSRIRKTIANRLVSALHESAMLTTFNEADMSTVIYLRKKHKESFVEKYGVKLGFMSFFVKAVVEALKAYPAFNSYIDGDDIIERANIDIGVAVGTDRGLFVPVLRNADQLTFAEIEQQIAEYATKARSGKLAISDLEGGSFTITNGGVYGSLLSTPILNPPQVGILGMHKIMERAVVEEGAIVSRPMMYLALSYDHRIVDGKEAVSFLVRMKEVLEEPSSLLL